MSAIDGMKTIKSSIDIMGNVDHTGHITSSGLSVTGIRPDVDLVVSDRVQNITGKIIVGS